VDEAGVTVRSWMKTLSLVGSDYLSLSVESKRLMAVLAIEILRISRELGLDEPERKFILEEAASWLGSF
jgi:hypothetical protein